MHSYNTPAPESGGGTANHDYETTKSCLTVVSLIFAVLVVGIKIYTCHRSQFEPDPTPTDINITIIHSQIPPTNPPAAAGLDRCVIEKLPTFRFGRAGSGSAECAICLSALEEGEMVKMLVKCEHLFHVGCIDVWLCGHSTCPVCRGDAKVREGKNVVDDVEVTAAPRLLERNGGGGGGERVETEMRLVVMVDGECDLERQ